jgi:hypothetical protein
VGTVVGFVYSGLDLGSAMTPPFLGFLLDHHHPRCIFIFTAGILLLAISTVSWSAATRYAACAHCSCCSAFTVETDQAELRARIGKREIRHCRLRFGSTRVRLLDAEFRRDLVGSAEVDAAISRARECGFSETVAV